MWASWDSDEGGLYHIECCIFTFSLCYCWAGFTRREINLNKVSFCCITCTVSFFSFFFPDIGDDNNDFNILRWAGLNYLSF